MSGDLASQLAGLEEMSSADLKSKWRALTGKPVPRVSPSLMRLALAWELQAKAYGGLSRRTQQKLTQLAEGKTRTSDVAHGMRLIRDWNGAVHVAEVAEDGAIRWNGKEWGSLSEVARQITGTRWSGPAFFGLKRKAAA